ncbi:MAG: F0F1 ATP synthase subunit delta [Bacteroidetes bacterium]|nr:F0F1 ATP synthase subunit delta [Bacteroidota bacterium]
MSVVQVASRYASALLEEAQRQDVLEVIYKDVQVLEQAVNASRDLNLMLKSPIVNSGIKKSSLQKIFGNHVSDLTSRFLNLLVKKNREAYLIHIIPAFFDAYNTLRNIQEVDVISAHPLSEELEQQIVKKVQHQLGDVTLKIKKSIDPELLGGFVVKVGDKVFDTSLHHKLNALKRELLAG